MPQRPSTRCNWMARTVRALLRAEDSTTSCSVPRSATAQRSPKSTIQRRRTPRRDSQRPAHPSPRPRASMLRDHLVVFADITVPAVAVAIPALNAAALWTLAGLLLVTGTLRMPRSMRFQVRTAHSYPQRAAAKGSTSAEPDPASAARKRNQGGPQAAASRLLNAEIRCGFSYPYLPHLGSECRALRAAPRRPESRNDGHEDRTRR